MNEITCYDLSGAPLDTLYQWDTNQYVVVRGAQVPPYPVFHFANRRSAEALVVAPEETGGSDLTVKIPNILLQQPETIIGYLFYETDDDAYRTKNAIRIPVVPRQMPADYMYTDNIGYPSVTAISTRLSEIIHIMSEGYSGEIAPEVTDIRIGSDGTVYQTAGDAVREQIINLSEQTRAGLSMKSDRNELAATNAEVDAIARRVGENKSDTDTKIAGLATDIDTINDQIGRVVNEVASSVILADATRSDLADLSATTDDLVQRVDDDEERLRLAESGIESLDDRMSSKAEQIDLAALFIESDVVKTKLNEHRDRLERAEERLSSKAEVNDVAAVQIESDIHSTEIGRLGKATEALADSVMTKAEQSDLAAAHSAIDLQTAELQGLRKEVMRKANGNELAAIASEIDTMVHISTFEALKDKVTAKAERNELASANAEIDKLQLSTNSLTGRVGLVQTAVADLSAQKVDKPNDSGSAGQVLTTNGDGTTSWSDPSVPTDAQIGAAVDAWLDDHPDATTTVEDGSITEAKLSPELIEMIGNGEDRDAQVMAAAVASEFQLRSTYSQSIFDNVTFTKKWGETLRAHAGRYLNPGFGFVFFTDPHNLTGRFGATPYSLIDDMRYIRTIWEHTPARYLFCGGDWLNVERISPEDAAWLVGQVVNLMRTEITPQAWTIFGNHDDNSESAQGSAFNLSREQIARLWYGEGSCYFVLSGGDDVDIYMLDANYSIQSVSDYQWSELDWLANKLNANTKSHLFGLGHNLGSVDSTYLGDALSALLDAYNRKTSITMNSRTYDFGNAVGTWHFLIGGHEHADKERTLNNIPIVITDNFFSGRAVDLTYAEWSGTLYLDRIGDGESRVVPIIPTGGYRAV